jgi:RNA polymerase sigma-70 factor, ECF subfamily
MDGADSECIRHCLNGQPEAFEHLVRRYQTPLVALLTGRLGDRGRAEEAAHDTFVRAFLRLKSLRRREAFFPWIVGIARYVALERRRAAPGALPVGSEPAAAAPSADDGPMFERAIAELPTRYQEVVLLRYYAGFECAEVAAVLGVPLGTVTKRLSRAYARLRAMLREPCATK